MPLHGLGAGGAWEVELPLPLPPLHTRATLLLTLCFRPGGGGGGGGGGELRRLRDDFAGAPILTVTNLHAVDVWRSGLLGVETKRRLEAKFGYIGGGWCCATKRDKQAGLPNNHGFHLDVMPPADLRLDAESGAREEAGPVET